MSVCPNCGQPVVEGNQFCTICGIDLSSIEFSSGGTVATLICPNGHAVDDETLSYCPECGAKLTRSPSISGSTEPSRIFTPHSESTTGKKAPKDDNNTRNLIASGLLSAPTENDLLFQ